MPKRIDLVGAKFGRLRVVSFKGRDSHRTSLWLCHCECGNQHVVARNNLRSGDVRSCGCLHDEVAGKSSVTHGMSKTRAYAIWKAMVKRCENPRTGKWHRYGGRGIAVCPAWRNSFEQFFADMGHPPDGMSIERKDNDKGYSPDNCEWATAREQSRNKSNIRVIEAYGKRQTIVDWSNECGVSRSTIAKRLNAGVDPERAVSARVVIVKPRWPRAGLIPRVVADSSVGGGVGAPGTESPSVAKFEPEKVDA